MRSPVDGEPTVSASVRRGGQLLSWRGAQYGAGFLCGVVIARTLGPAGRAGYALPLNLATLGWVVLHCSAEASFTRLLGRREATTAELAGASSTLSIVMGLATFALIVGVGVPIRNSVLGGASTLSVLLAAATIPPSIWTQLNVALLLRLGRVTMYGATLTAFSVVQLVLLVIAAATSVLTPEWTLAVNLLTSIGATIVFARVLAREVGGSSLRPFRGDGLPWRTVRIGLTVHMATIASFFNLRLDLLLVGAMLSAHEAGIYSLSVTLATVVVTATSTVGLAALKHQTEAPELDAASYTLEFVRQSFAVTVAFIVLIVGASYPLIVLAYGREWTGAVVPLVVLCIGAVALTIEGPVRTMLLRLPRPATISIAATTAALVNLAVNLVLIPRIGILGAAVASAISYWVAAALMLLVLHRRTGLAIRTVFGRPRSGDAVFEVMHRIRVRVGR